MSAAELFSQLRQMSGGKLTQEQVDAGDKIIKILGADVFAKLIGLKVKSGNMDISEAGYKLIKDFEGFSATSYKDTGGVWTIGYGTIKYPSGNAVKAGEKCTKEQADMWLKNDCKWVDACLDSSVKVPLKQNQFDALASFIYNIGENGFKKSTMLAKLNAGDYIGAAGQFDRWVYDNGEFIQGLANRREKEKALFLS